MTNAQLAIANMLATVVRFKTRRNNYYSYVMCCNNNYNIIMIVLKFSKHTG